VALTADDRLRRDVIERVMCDLEVDVEAVAAEHVADPAPLAQAAQGLQKFIEDGLASWDGRRIAVSERGRPFVRSVAALFDAHLAEAGDKPRHSRAV
jgi:oxygen-independent coproporphyrinogen-3 oxidase